MTLARRKGSLFTARHYRAVAQVLRATRPAAEGDRIDERAQWLHVVEEIAAMFKRDNFRFNRERFNDAAGVTT